MCTTIFSLRSFACFIFFALFDRVIVSLRYLFSVASLNVRLIALLSVYLYTRTAFIDVDIIIFASSIDRLIRRSLISFSLCYYIRGQCKRRTNRTRRTKQTCSLLQIEATDTLNVRVIDIYALELAAATTTRIFSQSICRSFRLQRIFYVLMDAHFNCEIIVRWISAFLFLFVYCRSLDSIWTQEMRSTGAAANYSRSDFSKKRQEKLFHTNDRSTRVAHTIARGTHNNDGNDDDIISDVATRSEEKCIDKKSAAKAIRKMKCRAMWWW